MRRSSWLIFVLFAALAHGQVSVSDDLFKYTGPVGFKQTMDQPINLSLADGKNNVNITILNVSAKGKTFNALTDEFLQIHKRNSSNLKVISDQKTTLNGVGARSVMMTRVSPSGVVVSERMVSAVRNNRGVFVLLATGANFKRFDGQFKKSLGSFKWLK